MWTEWAPVRYRSTCPNSRGWSLTAGDPEQDAAFLAGIEKREIPAYIPPGPARERRHRYPRAADSLAHELLFAQILVEGIGPAIDGCGCRE
jgi:hypothetical protein